MSPTFSPVEPPPGNPAVPEPPGSHCAQCLMSGQARSSSEAELREANRDRRPCLMLLDSIPSSVLLLDHQLRIVSANQKFLARSRLAESAVIGRRLEDVFPAVIYRDMNFQRRVSEVFRSGKAVEGERMVYRAPGLPARTYYYSFIPFRRDKEVRNVVLLMEDITDMIRLGEEVRNAERHLASVIESASDIVLSMCPSGKILTWNTAAVNVIGLQESEVRGRMLSELCAEPTRQILAQTLERVRRAGQTQRVELELTGRDGHAIPISWVFSAMRDADGRVVGLVAVGRDLTERRKLEAQLMQTEKLTALGVMAGGIAHELRNPLAVVSSSAQLLRDKVLPPEVAADCIERIFKGAMRMGGIIENLLCFARPADQGRKTALDLAMVIREAVALLNQQPEAKTWAVWTDLPDSPVPIRGNACLLQQLLTNLLQNGVNALTDRSGRIDVVLKKHESQAVLLVADTGCGISAAHLSKVFDPFFTAMPVGKGTGLGLSICHTIVQQHEGSIEIASREGRGTVVKVVLPLLDLDSSGNSIPPSGKRIPRDGLPVLPGERAAESSKPGRARSFES